MNIINYLTSTAKHFIIVTFAVILSLFSPAKHTTTNKINVKISPTIKAIVTNTPTPTPTIKAKSVGLTLRLNNGNSVYCEPEVLPTIRAMYMYPSPNNDALDTSKQNDELLRKYCSATNTTSVAPTTQPQANINPQITQQPTQQQNQQRTCLQETDKDYQYNLQINLQIQALQQQVTDLENQEKIICPFGLSSDVCNLPIAQKKISPLVNQIFTLKLKIDSLQSSRVNLPPCDK